MPLDAGSYLGAFEILMRDFTRLTEYVEPTDDNLTTHSHRLYELLLRTCTEFESACKDALDAQNYQRPHRGNLNVDDFVALEPTLKLETREVGIMVWRPHPEYVKPFNAWTTATPRLRWYKAYNTVKHNRSADFGEASLDNVRLALAALFALFDALKIIDQSKMLGVTRRGTRSNTATERVFPGYIFTVIARPGE